MARSAALSIRTLIPFDVIQGDRHLLWLTEHMRQKIINAQIAAPYPMTKVLATDFKPIDDPAWNRELLSRDTAFESP